MNRTGSLIKRNLPVWKQSGKAAGLENRLESGPRDGVLGVPCVEKSLTRRGQRNRLSCNGCRGEEQKHNVISARH